MTKVIAMANQAVERTATMNMSVLRFAGACGVGVFSREPRMTFSTHSQAGIERRGKNGNSTVASAACRC